MSAKCQVQGGLMPQAGAERLKDPGLNLSVRPRHVFAALVLLILPPAGRLEP